MRQRLIIILSLLVVVAVLVLLNAGSYVRVEATPDSESSPDRSTYNTGPTGTRALCDFLHESGYQIARWRESTSSLLSSSGPKPSTIVVVGDTKLPFSKIETKEILLWVASGGRLVIIDRTPDLRLLPKSGDWVVKTLMTNFPWPDLDPTDFEAMTREVKPIAPSQPALLASKVESIVPSRFASAITFSRQPSLKNAKPTDSSTPESGGSANGEEASESDTEPTPQPSHPPNA